MGGRGTFNVSAFYMDIEDLQATVTAGSCSSRVIFNVPKARSTGRRGRVRAAAPTDSFDFAISASYNNSELRSTLTSTDAPATSGRRGHRGGQPPADRPRVPGGGRGHLSAGRCERPGWATSPAAYQHVGSRFTQIGDQAAGFGTVNLNSFGANTIGGPLTQSTFTFDPELPAYDIVNLRLGFLKGKWDVALFVNNLTDERGAARPRPGARHPRPRRLPDQPAAHVRHQHARHVLTSWRRGLSRRATFLRRVASRSRIAFLASPAFAGSGPAGRRDRRRRLRRLDRAAPAAPGRARDAARRLGAGQPARQLRRRDARHPRHLRPGPDLHRDGAARLRRCGRSSRRARGRRSTSKRARCGCIAATTPTSAPRCPDPARARLPAAEARRWRRPSAASRRSTFGGIKSRLAGDHGRRAARRAPRVPCARRATRFVQAGGDRLLARRMASDRARDGSRSKPTSMSSPAARGWPASSPTSPGDGHPPHAAGGLLLRRPAAARSATPPAASRSGSTSASASSTASPTSSGRGFKVADDTRGDAFDPTSGDRTPSAEGIARARRFLAERFPELAKAPAARRARSASTRTAPTATSSSTATRRRRTSGSWAAAPATASSWARRWASWPPKPSCRSERCPRCSAWRGCGRPSGRPSSSEGGTSGPSAIAAISPRNRSNSVQDFPRSVYGVLANKRKCFR